TRMRAGGADEAAEQRVAVARARRELGVELAAEEPRVVRQLDHLHELAVLGRAGEHEPRLLEAVEIVVVELVAVAVALGHGLRAVGRGRERVLLQQAALRAEAHRAALVRMLVAALDLAGRAAPLGDERDDRVRRVALELGRVRAVEPGDVARVLDDRDLHAEADAKIWHTVLARVLRRGDLALDA